MLDRMVETARQREIFCREDTPTEQRVLAAFLYPAGLSYRKIEPFVDRSYEAVRQWYHRLSGLFEPDRDDRPVVAVDETKIAINGEERYVWAAIDTDTFEAVHVEVSAGRSSLDALLFLKEVLKRCRGQPLIKVDRGPWYEWPLEELPCEYEQETWGKRSLVEALFGLVKYRTMLFWHRFPVNSSIRSTDRWIKSFAALLNAIL